MSTFRATALAGPGPSTWLYRISKLTNAQPLTASRSSLSFRTFAHTPSPCGSKGKQRATARQTYSDASAAASPRSTNEEHDQLGVIFLRPPADYPIDDQMHLLHRALMEIKLDTALQVWSNLIDLGSTSRLSDGDWYNISSFVQIAISARQAPILAKMAVRQSHKFGVLRHMAMESAARGHVSGLFTLLLKLVEAGRPSDALSAFAECKERMRDLQGKAAKNLLSWNREERLAARLVGENLRDLMFANVAALTLLDKCDEHALFSMLDSQTDLRPSAKYDFDPFERTFARTKNGTTLLRRFRQNIENLVLALQCFHPDALVARINTLSSSRTSGRLEALYERIMEASIGPKAFIRARDLEELGMDTPAYTNIPLAPVVWWQFIRAFERRNSVDQIIKTIDKDMPERGLRPNDNFVSLAMVHMAIIASRPNLTENERSKARMWVDEYWRRLTSEGWHTRDIAFSRRIRVFSILSKREPRLRDELRTVYRAARDGHLGGIGPKTRAAFVECFMVLKRVDEALASVEKLPRSLTASNDQDDFEPALAVLIRRLALAALSPQEKMAACTNSLRLGSQLNVSLRTVTLGPLLAIQIQGGLPMKRAVDTILEYTLDEKLPQHGIQRWTLVLSSLLTKSTQGHSPTLPELQAGLYILQRASVTELFGHTRTRLVAMWLSFLRPCATSRQINHADRQLFIDEALSLFPEGRSGISVGMWFDLIENLFGRSEGGGEGWRRWGEALVIREEVGMPIPAFWWNKMLKLLLEKDRMEFALDLVRDAWERKAFGLEEGFWLRARSAGLTKRLGIENHFQEFDRDLSKGRRAAGSGKWREPLSLSFMVADDEVELYADAVEGDVEKEVEAVERAAVVTSGDSDLDDII